MGGAAGRLTAGAAGVATWTGGGAGGGAEWRSGSRLGRRLFTAGSPHIVASDSTTGTGADEGANLDAQVASQLPRRRGGQDFAPLRFGGGQDLDRSRRNSRWSRYDRGTDCRRWCACRSVIGRRWLTKRSVGVDDDHDLADGAQLAGGNHDLGDPAGAWRRDLDGRFVGHDLDHRLIFAQRVTFGGQPADDLTFDDAFANVGESELEGHGLIPRSLGDRLGDPLWRRQILKFKGVRERAYRAQRRGRSAPRGAAAPFRR
jgi:hypothetical protein